MPQLAMSSNDVSPKSVGTKISGFWSLPDRAISSSGEKRLEWIRIASAPASA